MLGVEENFQNTMGIFFRVHNSAQVDPQQSHAEGNLQILSVIIPSYNQ